MAGVGEMITGSRAKRSARLAEAAQADEQRRVAEEASRLAAMEAGQRQAGEVGGYGLLSFIDSKRKATFG